MATLLDSLVPAVPRRPVDPLPIGYLHPVLADRVLAGDILPIHARQYFVLPFLIELDRQAARAEAVWRSWLDDDPYNVNFRNFLY